MAAQVHGGRCPCEAHRLVARQAQLARQPRDGERDKPQTEMTMADRTNIYYWKCDREDAFHGTSDYQKDQTKLLAAVEMALRERFGDALKDVSVSCGQGNHRTFEALLDGRRVFIRTEDGVERDNYLAVEAAVEKSKEKLYQAAMMDPHTGNCTDADFRIADGRTLLSVSLALGRSVCIWAQ